MSIDEIRSVVREEKRCYAQSDGPEVGKFACHDVGERSSEAGECEYQYMMENALKKLDKSIDESMANQQDKHLQKLCENVRQRIDYSVNENDDPVTQEAKRRCRSLSAEPGTGGMRSVAQDRLGLRRQDDEERHVIVFTGFPAKTRKKLVIDHVKIQLNILRRLTGCIDDFDFMGIVFAPSSRTNIAMLRLPSKAAMFDFLRAWKLAEETGQITRFGENEAVIRAKRDKPPALRKAHGKIWRSHIHFKRRGFADVEIDWRTCSVWVYECEVVKWDLDTDELVWMEQEIAKHPNLKIDVEAAKLALTQARDS